MVRPREPVVLLAFASVDERRPLRNLSREEREIRAALEPLVAAGELDDPLTLWNATADGVVEVFQKDRFRGRIRVFHFGGHASGTELMLADMHGAPAVAHATGLADYLGAQGLALVFLNGCSTREQIERLRRAGVGAVVATSRAIMDDVAADFAGKFYAELGRRPLKLAFDAASAAVRLKQGDSPRELVSDEAADLEWDDQWPWLLACEPKHEGWMLLADGGAALDDAREQELVDELARVIWDQGAARVLLSHAGFPRQRMPRFDTSLEFWAQVVEEAQNGVLTGGVDALVERATAMYPGNPVFARHRAGGHG